MDDYGFELTWWDDNGGNSIALEDWQMFAIQQVLGLEIIPDKDGYVVKHFTKHAVAERLNKMGILKEAEREEKP